MATSHYNFPTIVGTDTIDGVNAINGLANAVDTALFTVASSIPSIPTGYDLPIATATALGGVRGGGEIAVSSASGDMTIAAGVVTNSKLAANAVGASNIQNNSVSAAKLTSDVSSQLNAGYQASLSLQSHPIRHSMTTSTGNLYGTYVVNPAAQMVTLKLNAQGATFNLENKNSSVNSPLFTFNALPVQYRPTTSFSQVMAVQSVTGSGLYTVYGFIRDDGVAGVYITNWGAGVASGQQLYADCQIAWFYNVQSAS